MNTGSVAERGCRLASFRSLAARRFRTALVLPLLAVASGTASGQEAWRDWQLYWENDSFVSRRYSSDEYYTNGIRLTLSRAPTATWGWARGLGSWWLGVLSASGDYDTTSSLAIGQNLFTPGVITEFEVDPRDRPYAALLYTGARVDMNRQDGRVQHSIEFDLGVMGPPAMGRQVQSGVHLLRKNRIPKGWDHQIGTEIGVNLLYAARRRSGSDHVDVTPQAGLALGTTQTYATAGATLRVGWHMTGFPASPIPWTAPPRGKARRRSFEVALFAGIDGRYLLRNAYLDGSLIGGPPSVEKEPFVHDIRYGLTARVCSWRITYSFVRRSKEFTPPPERGDGSQDFGSLSISRELGW